MKSEDLDRIWTDSADGYSKIILDEYFGSPKKAWVDIIEEHRPAGEGLKVLDIGTGPGFFAIILSNEGHYVEACDISEGMLDIAKNNVAEYGNLDKVSFHKMDARHLDFDDNTFDMVINRNVTWMDDDLKHTYGEWLRVLKPGGRFLVFDANWGSYLFDKEEEKLYKENIKKAEKYGFEPGHGKNKDQDGIDMAKLPLSNKKRPDYDRQILSELGCDKVYLEDALPMTIMNKMYAIAYDHLRMFLVVAEK